MAEQPEIVKPFSPEQLAEWIVRVNQALENYSDKDWNYSRISLQLRKLSESPEPYLLWLDLVDPNTKEGRAAIKAATDEISWGSRHSDQLGVLEIISLRVNKALLESTSDESWGSQRPVVRLVKKQSLAQQGIGLALWYKVLEVSGEDFDSR